VPDSPESRRTWWFFPPEEIDMIGNVCGNESPRGDGAGTSAGVAVNGSLDWHTWPQWHGVRLWVDVQDIGGGDGGNGREAAVGQARSDDFEVCFEGEKDSVRRSRICSCPLAVVSISSILCCLAANAQKAL
jgi:hypothetical protein